MKGRKLIHIYMGYITLAITAVMTLNLAWSIRLEKVSGEQKMLAKAQLITQQFLAVRSFAAANQDRINFDSQGNFEFKRLNPAAFGRGVGEIFNSKTSYTFKQTRLQPRNAANAPDKFESAQLLWLQDNPEADFIWEKDILEGETYFRYVIPLYADSSCLPCHGSPRGEIDISGYPREGLALGDFAGALSVTIPAATYYAQLWKNIYSQLFFIFLLLCLSLFLLYVLQRKLVTAPLEGLSSLAIKLGKGDFRFKEEDWQQKGYGEIRVLEEIFQNMSKELLLLYENLENKVQAQTLNLEQEKQKLFWMNEELQKLNRLQGDFLAAVSHELRTPLTCILAFVELLEIPGFSQEERQQNLQDLRESATQLLNMINNLLDTAKLDSVRIRLDNKNQQPKQLVLGIVKAFGPLLRKKGLELELELAEDLPVVYCDTERVKQVIVNLLGNAVKFTAPGGKISVSIQTDLQKPDRVIFSVCDNGPGINKEDQPFIFERFRQGVKQANNRPPGSGLGLYLSKGLVEMQGGEIWLESEPGRGATFSFTLPTASAKMTD
ncbi:MAG: Signal transduction histidine-protein kinase BarA [Syntrophomonadaceae bacterium]|nr:Signal transduction histidine-protein kinase BarA [Bacillota bacterium]